MNISNSSVEQASPPKPYNQTYWIVCEVVLIPITLICIYYLKSLIFYLRKKREKKNRGQLKLLLVLNLIAVVIALARFISDQIVAFLGWQTNDYCFYSVSVSVELYSAGFSFVYIFLWTRQYSFYSNTQLQTLYNRKIVFIGYACLALLVVGWIALSVVYVLPSVTGWIHAASPEGCRDINDEQDIELLPILVALIAGLGQISLLALLLYPLLNHRTKDRKEKPSSKVTPTHSNPRQGPSSRNKNVRQNNGTPKNAVVFADQSNHLLSGYANTGYLSEDASGFESDGEFNSNLATSKSVHNNAEFTPTKTVQQRQRDQLLVPGMAAHRNSVQGLISHKQQTAKRKETTPKRSRTEKRRIRRMQKLIKKVFFLALICVCTDVVATSLQLLLVTPELVYLVIYDVNLIINITCIIMSFEKWKTILFSCEMNCTRKNKRRTSSVTSQMSLQSMTTRTDKLERFFNSIRGSRTREAASSVSSVLSSRPGSPKLYKQTGV